VKGIAILMTCMVVMISLFISCSQVEDDPIDVSNQFYTDMVTVGINKQSKIYFTHDNGDKFMASSLDSGLAFVWGSRLLLTYSFKPPKETDNEGYYHIIPKGYRRVYNSYPTVPANMDSLILPALDPVKVESLWTGNAFLNMAITYDYYIIPHVVLLIEKSCDTISANHSVTFDFFHSKAYDTSGMFTRNYLSFSLNRYHTADDAPLSVHVNVLTEDSVWTNYERKITWPK